MLDVSFEDQEKIMFDLEKNVKNLMKFVIPDIYMPPPLVMRIMDED